MKKFLSIFLLLVVLFMVSCSGDGGKSGGHGNNDDVSDNDDDNDDDDDDSIRKPAKLGISSNSTALFTGKASEVYAKLSLLDRIHAAIFRSAYAASDKRVLYQITDDGTVEIVPILDENGDEIAVDIKQLNIIGPKIVGISLSVGRYSEYRVVGSKDTGLLYDMSEYMDIKQITQGFADDEIIVIHQGELRKISLSTKTVQVLNNTNVEKVQDYVLWTYGYYGSVQITGYQYIYPALLCDGKIIASTGFNSFKKYDPAGIEAPVVVPLSEIGEWGGSFDWENSILSPNGKIYKFITGTEYVNGTGKYTITIRLNKPGDDYNSGAVVANGTVQYDSVTADARRKLLQIHHNYLPHEGNRYMVLRDGYLKTSFGADGVPVGVWTEKNCDFLFDLKGDLLIRGSVVYGLDSTNKKILKADIVADTALTTLYESPLVIAKMWTAGDTLFYTAYRTATAIETYKIAAGSTTPELVDSSDMEVGNIVEFTL